MADGIGGHGPVAALGELAGDGGLRRRGEVGAFGVSGQALCDPRGRCLQPREGEVAVLAAQEHARQHEARRIAGCGQGLQRRAARVGQAQRLGDLVEGLAGCVVDGRAQAAAGADAIHRQQLTMPAGNQQQQEGIVHLGRQPRGDRMAL